MAAILGLLASAMALFYWLKDDPRLFRRASPYNVNLTLLLGLLGLGLSGKATPAAFRILLAYITGSLTFYLLTGYTLHDLTVGHPAADWMIVPVAFALASYWRPALSILPIMAVMWTKILARKDFGLGISSTDYMVVVELGVLLCLFIIPASLLSLAARIPRAPAERLTALRRDYLNAAVVIGAAVHLANYFYSGHTKLVLENAGLLTWVLENPTYILTPITKHFGYLTIFEFPWMPQWMNAALVWITVPLNAAVLLAQLAVVFAFFSRRFMIGVTMFFDLMHTAIFALTAIFFWKWILLNLGMVHAFHKLRRDNWRIPLWLGTAALVVMFAAPNIFQVAHLGWFDSGGVNYAYWQAETKDGKRIKVPTNFFLSTSISFAQQRPGRPFTGFLPTHDWGTTMDAKVMHKFTDACAPDAQLAPALDPAKTAIAGDFVLRHHARVLERAGGSGNIAYDVYPHHIWSSPFASSEFRALDLAEVSAYILVVEAKCISVAKDGSVNIKELARHETRFPL